MAGRFLEEFVVGQVFSHDIRRTATETDNLLFTALTYNPAAIHIDAAYCAVHTEFGKPLVNSMFTLALMVGVSVGDTTLGTTIANLGYERIDFPHPVFIGDTLHAETQVIAVRASASKPDRGIVTFEHRSFNQRDELVARAVRAALMKRREAG
jgi:acyl dehydratase